MVIMTLQPPTFEILSMCSGETNRRSIARNNLKKTSIFIKLFSLFGMLQVFSFYPAVEQYSLVIDPIYLVIWAALVSHVHHSKIQPTTTVSMSFGFKHFESLSYSFETNFNKNLCISKYFSGLSHFG